MTEYSSCAAVLSETPAGYGWQYAPLIVLEQVFSLLPRLSDLYSCSMVCKHWLNVFRCGRHWRRLVIAERTFTRRKFHVKVHRWAGVEGVPSSISDEEIEPEYEVNHWRLQVYLGKFGGLCQRLSFAPITNYHNLFEFLRVSELLTKTFFFAVVKIDHNFAFIVIAFDGVICLFTSLPS